METAARAQTRSTRKALAGTSVAYVRFGVEGLTTLIIDQRVSYLGVSSEETEKHAWQAGIVLFEGLRAKTG